MTISRVRPLRCSESTISPITAVSVRLRDRDAALHRAEPVGPAEGQDGRDQRAHAGLRGADRGQLGDLLGQQIVAHRRMRALVLMTAHRQQDDRVGVEDLARLAAGDRAHMDEGVGLRCHRSVSWSGVVGGKSSHRPAVRGSTASREPPYSVTRQVKSRVLPGSSSRIPGFSANSPCQPSGLAMPNQGSMHRKGAPPGFDQMPRSL